MTDKAKLWTPTDALAEMQKDIGFAIWKLKQMAKPDTLAAMVRIQEALQAAMDKEGLAALSEGNDEKVDVVQVRNAEMAADDARRARAKERGVWAGDWGEGTTGENCNYCGKVQLPMTHGSTASYPGEVLIWFACCGCFGECEIGESGVCADITRALVDDDDDLPF